MCQEQGSAETNVREGGTERGGTETRGRSAAGLTEIERGRERDREKAITRGREVGDEMEMEEEEEEEEETMDRKPAEGAWGKGVWEGVRGRRMKIGWHPETQRGETERGGREGGGERGKRWVVT